MRNDGADACQLREAVKQLSMEMLDESAGKRFDTGGRLFWYWSMRADDEEARRMTEARAK